MATARLSTGFRRYDWRALLWQHRRTLWRATAASAIVIVAIVSAAWTMRALTGGRTTSVTSTVAAAEVPAPVLGGLAPKQKLRTRWDAQPIALNGTHLTDDMTVTISTPDGRVATYGSSSLSNVISTYEGNCGARHHDHPFGTRSGGERTIITRTGTLARDAIRANPGFNGFNVRPGTVRVPSGNIRSEFPADTRDVALRRCVGPHLAIHGGSNKQGTFPR